MITSCVEMSSHDRKIIKFDVSEGYEAFYSLFNDDEVEEMREAIKEERDYTDSSLEEVKDLIVLDYCRLWLIDNIRELRYAGTEELFNIIFNMN